MRPRYCCFYLHQRLRLGWARGERQGQLDLVAADGESVTQRADNVLYAWQGLPAAGEAEALAQLAARSAELSAQSGRLDALYGAMPSGEPQPFEALAAEAGLKPADGWAHGLLFAALHGDKARFRYSNGTFTARSETEVTARLARDRERDRREAWLAKAQRWHAELQAGGWTGEDADAPEFLAQLRSLLALERRSPHWGLLARPLGLHALHPLDLASHIKSWLVSADAWPDWPAIWLQGAQVPEAFPPEQTRSAAGLAGRPPRADARRDFTAVPAFTFDGAGTRDFDDAVAVLAADAEGLTVAVHIAEPDPALVPGHPVFDEAEARMASVYTPSDVYPMLPESLSAARFSLQAGAEREVVSFLLRIEEGEARLEGVERGLVRIERNLDYAAGQALLDAEPDSWGRLALLCGTLADARAQAGAVMMERRDTVVDVSDPGRIRVRQTLRSGPVQQLVEELAILHNREAGRYCRDHRLPAIYRVQPPPRRGGAPGEEAEQHAAARFTTRGGSHAGLACDRYIQTTSPIRRFPDLVMQRQIAEHAAAGRIAFAERERMEAWAERADARMSVLDEVSRRIANDWKRRYLLQNRGRTFEGVVRRRWDADHGRVLLEALALLAECVLPAGVHDGDRVQVRVESVNRDHQTVWVACVE